MDFSNALNLAWLPDWLDQHPALWLALQCALAVLLGLVVHLLVDRVMAHAAHRSEWAAHIRARGARPARWLLPLLFMHAALGDQTGTQATAVAATAQVQQAVVVSPRLIHLTSVAVILVFSWLVVSLIKAVEDLVEQRYPVDGLDNLRARSVRTKSRVLTRTLMFIIGLVGAASVLMTFPSVRQIGASLLASAGVAGIVAGLAARPVLGNLIAGIQIALTQPIRLDDVLIVEGEWGRVEEITATYVVVRIWDDRRLVVPLEYFIQQPFQNWTRRTSDLLGSVFVWVDHGMPIEVLRQELRRIVEKHDEWDRRVCVLQVTDVSDRAVQLRALVSTLDASRGWDLRCKVREELVAFMQQHYPRYLPQTRGQLLNGPDGASRASDLAPPPQPGPGVGGSVQHAPITP